MEEKEVIIGASIDRAISKDDPFSKSDPFNGNWETLKTLDGLDANFKRRTSRLSTKMVEPTKQYTTSALAGKSGIDGAQSKEINPGLVYVNGYGMFDVITPPWNLYELANYYDTSFANHAAIDAKVENIVGLGYEFKVSPRTMLRLESSEDNSATQKARKRIERTKIELRDWLESLNDDDSFTATMEKVYTDLQSTGNGYLEIGRTTRGDIGYVGHIPATTMRVRRLKDGYVQIIGNKIVYFRNFGARNPNPLTTDSRPNEIIHFKQYSPLNTFYGVPDIYIPLPGDSENNKVEFKMEPIEDGIQDGSFKEYRKQNRDDILVAHQVPLSKLGGGDSASIAAALAQDRTFKEQVARPAQRQLEKMINKIIREKTDIVEFVFNELTLTDEIAQSQILERYVKNQIMTPNEARVVLDMPQRDGGDEVLNLKPEAAAEATTTRSRDSERTNNNSDSSSTVAGRNPKGEGRKTP